MTLLSKTGLDLQPELRGFLLRKFVQYFPYKIIRFQLNNALDTIRAGFILFLSVSVFARANLAAAFKSRKVYEKAIARTCVPWAWVYHSLEWRR